MNKTNKVIVVIVLVLVVAFGVAQFFASPGISTVAPSLSQSSSPSGKFSTSTQPSVEAVLSATQIIQFEPMKPASSTPIEKGSCWTNSIAAPFRGDAWRCSVKNSVSDPCFQIPGSHDLVCGINPEKPGATSTFVLQLTQPLPKSRPVQGLQPSEQVWLAELQGGTLCSPYTGTLPFTATGEAATYGCAPGPLGREVVIYQINSSSGVWTADIGRFAASAVAGQPTVVTSSTVQVAKVWR